MFKTILLILTIAVIFPTRTHAYIDPGTGSYLLQIILGGIFGGVFILKSYWQKIVLFFKSKTQNKNNNTSKIKSENPNATDQN